MATNGVASNGVAGDFKPKNILVTGGAGFIASHVALRLVKNYPEYKVVVLDKLDYCSSTNNLASVKDRPNFKFVKGDIQSMDLMAFLLRTEEIDTVMHFAAQVGRQGDPQGGGWLLKEGGSEVGLFQVSARQLFSLPTPRRAARCH
jgi:NAD(P)-dependent dehydrogenase (short-subunit alcohol dehydrogenase family)